METEKLTLELQTKSEYLSSNIDVAAAVKNKFNEKKFKFYNINNWGDINELKQKILPTLLAEIDQTGLNLNGEDLFYDLKAFNLVSTNAIVNSTITITLKYFDHQFSLKLVLDDNITNEDLLLALKDWSKNNKNYLLNLLSIEIEDPKSLLDKVENWCNNITNKVSLIINTKKKTLPAIFINVIGIDTAGLKNNSNNRIQLFFNCNQSSAINQLTIPAKITLIKVIEIRNYLENIINLKSPSYFGSNITRETFFVKTNFQNLLNEIQNKITNKFQFQGQNFDIKLPIIKWNFTPSSKQHLKIPSWHNECILPLKCQFYQQEIILHLKIKIMPVIFYEIIQYFEKNYDFGLTTANTGTDVLKELIENFKQNFKISYYDNSNNIDEITFDLANKNYNRLVKFPEDKWEIMLKFNNEAITFQKEFKEIYLKIINIKNNK